MWWKKVEASDPQHHQRDELFISLPVEQQLLELKPNGSNVGNHGIPTLSGRLWDRKGAFRIYGEKHSGLAARLAPPPVDP
jgi:hypothetical protein